MLNSYRRRGATGFTIKKASNEVFRLEEFDETNAIEFKTKDGLTYRIVRKSIHDWKEQISFFRSDGPDTSKGDGAYSRSCSQFYQDMIRSKSWVRDWQFDERFGSDCRTA